MITQGKIGGSLIAAVAGINPRVSRFEAARRIIDGYMSPSTLASRMGLHMEPLLRELYVEETGAKLLGPRTVTNAKHPWAEIHLDDETEAFPVELKTSSVRLINDWGDQADSIPIPYLAQVQFYMAITEKPRCDVVVAIGNEDYRIYPIQADAPLQGLLIEAGAQFHRDFIATGKMPPIDGSDGCAEWIADKYPRETKPLIAADEGLTEIVRLWRDAKKAVETAEDLEAEARNKLISLIGHSEGLMGSDYKCTYKSQKGRASTDWKGLVRAAGIPEALINKFTTEGTPFRVLRYTEKK